MNIHGYLHTADFFLYNEISVRQNFLNRNFLTANVPAMKFPTAGNSVAGLISQYL